MSEKEDTAMLRSAILKLIDAVVYHLGSDEYENPDDDEHYQYLVTNKVEAIFEIAELIGYDLWSEKAGPVGTTEYVPIARLLREADATHGMQRCCEVPGCEEEPVRLRDRPKALPRGTRWPTCPELCARHAVRRCELLVQSTATRPVHAGLMPLPEVAHLAVSPEVLGQLERDLRSVPNGADRAQGLDPPN